MGLVEDASVVLGVDDVSDGVEEVLVVFATVVLVLVGGSELDVLLVVLVVLATEVVLASVVLG